MRSCLIGPPMKPPPRCWLNGAWPEPCAFENGSCASSDSSRWNRKPRPCSVVGPRARDDADDGAGRVAVLGRELVGDDDVFAHRFHRETAARAGEHVVVVADAVDAIGVVAIQLTAGVHAAAADAGHAGRGLRERGEGASGHRQRIELLTADRRARACCSSFRRAAPRALTVTVSCTVATFMLMLMVSSWPSVSGTRSRSAVDEARQLGFDRVHARAATPARGSGPARR